MDNRYHSIIEAVIRQAETIPDQLCIADISGTYSYRSFRDLCGRMAGLFHSSGITRGDRVIVETVQRAEYLAVEFGLHLLGAVFIPLENRCTSIKINEIAKTSGAVLTVAQKKPEGSAGLSCRTWMELRAALEETDISEDIFSALPNGIEMSEILFSTGTTGKEKGASF